MEISCNHCGEKVSGPVDKSVIAAMERHRAKAKHPAPVVPPPAPGHQKKGVFR